MSDLALVFDPSLVEEAVLLAIRGHAEEHRFRDERDGLYALPEDRRAAAFNAVHGRWFVHLGLAAPVHTAVAELPLLAETCGRGIVVRALNRREEGADLLVAPDVTGPEARTVVIRLRSSSCLAPAALLIYLRTELLHVADMVTPAFAYEPRLAVADEGAAYEQLVRERYRVLWEVSIAGRLCKRGVAAASTHDEARGAFIAAFPMLGGASDAAFAHFFSTWPLTHHDLAAFAADPRANTPAPALVAGGRCPLCRFPTYAPDPAPETLAAETAALIMSEFPAWSPAQGLCRQCADLYRARRSSAPATTDVMALASCTP